jgi:thioredoxin-related protein
MSRRIFVPLALVALGLTLAPALAAETAAEPREEIYDTKADPRADIAAAVERAGAAGKNVLVVFGANWCSWCRHLHGTFTGDDNVKKVLDQDYEVVRVNIGQWDTNVDLAEHYSVHLRETGIPCLSLLAGDGEWLANHPPEDLETQDPEGYDGEKLAAFLAAWPEKAAD